MKSSQKKTLRPRFIVGAIVVILLGLATYAVASSSAVRTVQTTKLVYSQSALLGETWSTFKADYIESGSGRTLVDHTGNITDARLQSDTLLRSVYIDDKATFDSSWTWTKNNDRLDNGLIASQYGPRADGSYRMLSTVNDPAADTNAALALLMAYVRWDDQAYLNDAKALISSLHDASVVTVNGSPVMTTSAAGDTVAIDPATINPAAFKEFAKVDPSHDWTGLAANSYTLTGSLLKANNNSMPETATIGTTGDVTVTDKLSGPDAFTAVFNLGRDYAWNTDPRALSLMIVMPYAPAFSQSGSVLTRGTESAATYGKLMPYLDAVAPRVASQVFATKLTDLYNQDQQSWTLPLSSTDSTWAWFGIASHNGVLRQLTEIQS